MTSRRWSCNISPSVTDDPGNFGGFTKPEFYNFSFTELGSGATVKYSSSHQQTLNKEYDEFEAYLARSGLVLEDLPRDCLDVYDTCLFGDAQTCLAGFKLQRDIFFFPYLPLAIFLVTLAIIFNALSILLVIKVRHKTPRHFLLINMSISDLSLCLFTVIKRSADFLRDSTPAKLAILLYGNMVWQALWLISGFGILLVGLDCFFAVQFVFAYEKPLTGIIVRLVVASLWAASFVFSGLLVHFELSYSRVIQVIICLIMVAILTAIVALSLYAFSLTERIRRLQVSTIRDDRTRRQVRLGRFKSTLTIVILLSSWLPLVIFFSVPEDQHSANIDLSHKFLAFCLLCFHCNAIVNPIVYSLRFKDVRAPLRRFLVRHRFTKRIGEILLRLDDDLDSLPSMEALRHRRKTASCSSDVDTTSAGSGAGAGTNKARSASFGGAGDVHFYNSSQSSAYLKMTLNSISENPKISAVEEGAGQDKTNNNNNNLSMNGKLEKTPIQGSISSVFANNNNYFHANINDNNSEVSEAGDRLLVIKKSHFKTGDDENEN